jgi:superfamily II RNA helicase
MVKICDIEYPEKNEQENKDFFAPYLKNFGLHDFQKWSIEATINGHHVLACAPTGSGKSLCAEFAIDFFSKKGKKSIYCSPIKSLSNQKYYDFQRKFPSTSIGLITGDIKINNEADIIIMTTEILLSTILNSNTTSFNVDEIGCVIFDEIHMIGDKDRGHVWENSILRMPPHIQMIGLSATLDNPEQFATWMETKGQLTLDQGSFSDQCSFSDQGSFKQVYLTRKLIRPVPLTHYCFITTNTGIFKAIKDKAVHQEIRLQIDKPHIIQDPNGTFNDQTYLNINKVLNLFSKNDVRVKRQHVLNNVSKFLVENEMLPALCYVFSIKQLERCAEEITTPLLEFDSKIPYTIDRECEHIIRKLPNYKEYLHLPEYTKLVALLQKGVGIHHSKMIPVLREIVELLFARGLIKMLFCTTSVAIGLNLPVKTSIFTDIYKHNGSHVCILEGHEYVQAAGRAGRLGIDTVGNVIHLNNLFGATELSSYKKMLKGAPQKLISFFKVSYNLLFNMIEKNDNNVLYAKRSMIQYDIDRQLGGIKRDIDLVTDEIDKINSALEYITKKVPESVLKEYLHLKRLIPSCVNKKRKETERAISKLEDEYKTIVKDVETYKKHLDKELELDKLTNQFTGVDKYLDNNIVIVLNMLEERGFVGLKEDRLTYSLTLKGKVASHFKEVPCLIFADLVLDNVFASFSAYEMAGILSCFTNVKVSDDKKTFLPVSNYKKVTQLLKEIHDSCNIFMDLELKNGINTGTDYEIIFDLTDYIIFWAECDSEPECKFLLQQMSEEKDIFLGEFVKAILKVVAITVELAAVAELIGDMELLQKCKEVPSILQKFVATNQSLYI